MILETDKMLKHIGSYISYIERPDLKHTDCSMLYLPYRVCEDCYLLFETMNDIKTYQIEIANYFRNPVDQINFGLDYYNKEKEKTDGVHLNEEELNTINLLTSYSIENTLEGENKVIGHTQVKNNVQILNKLKIEENYKIPPTNIPTTSIEKSIKTKDHKPQCLYRIMIMFTDLFWNEVIKIPDKELYLLFNFLGSWYKVKIGTFYPELDYFNINFFKIFYIICEETEGFIEYVDKNKQMVIKLGYFENNQSSEKEKVATNLFSKEIVIEDNDLCKITDNFIQFATVELSLQGLKYGENYRNSLNGLLFKQDKPYYVGKLRCVIRISREGKERDKKSKSGKDVFKHIDISKYNLRKHFNVIFYL